MLNQRQRKHKRNRNKSIQQKRQLLMESCEVRAAAASLSLPFGDMGSALQVDDQNQAAGFNESQHEVSQAVQAKQLGQERARGTGAPPANKFQGRSFSPVNRVLQAPRQQDSHLQKSVHGVKKVHAKSMSPTAWQTRIDVGMMQDVLAAAEGKEAGFQQSARSAKQHDFQAPAVQANRLEDPLTFRQEADASAAATISRLLQLEREHVSVDSLQRGMEEEVTTITSAFVSDGLEQIVSSEALRPWYGDGTTGACGTSSGMDSVYFGAQTAMVSDYDSHHRFDGGGMRDTGTVQGSSLAGLASSRSMSYTPGRTDRVTFERPATSGETSSSAPFRMASRMDLSSTDLVERSASTGTARDWSERFASGMSWSRGAVAAPWSSMFDTDSAIQADHLELVQDYMEQLGIDSLEDAGTIKAHDITEQIDQGVHVLQASSASSMGLMLPSPPPLMPFTITDLDGTLEVAGVSMPADVVRFDEDVVIDTAVIIADTVCLDDAVVTLAENITEFIIVANTVVGYGDSLIQWEMSGTAALDDETDPGQAADGDSGSPHRTPSDAEFVGDDGGNGADGDTGARGEAGSLTGAPDVHIYMKEFTLERNTSSSVGTYQVAFPDFDLSGRQGGKGGQGEDGGDGGHGDMGRDSIPGIFDCNSGPGWGGDGGDGGDGGRGGTGGAGSDGGDLNLYVVNFPHDTNVYSFDVDLSGGEGGAGGDGGAGGEGGEGGDRGDLVGFWCGAWWNTGGSEDRSGDDGSDGRDGDSGSDGRDGSDGDIALAWIDEEEWEEAFTRPYLVSPSSSEIYVGETITFDTLNLTGSATLTVKDLVTDVETDYELAEMGDGQYDWETSTGMDAAHLEVLITRDHDGLESNSYGVELLPVMEEVVFGESICSTTCTIVEDSYEAVPGGEAHLLGHGFRGDSRLIYDGQVIEGWTMESHADGRDMISFTIPREATDGDYFIRENGTDDHAIYLDQTDDLADSDSVEFHLKKSTGLTFDPAANGFYFFNSDMADTAQDFVTDRSFEEIWDIFRATYGYAEVDFSLVLPTPTILNFVTWYAWWAADGSATCMGLSTAALTDYFGGTSDQVGVVEDDVVESIMETQGHLLSPEILGSLVWQGYDDSATGDTVDAIVDFFDSGTTETAGEAPVIIMAPDGAVYTDAMASAALVVADIVSLLDGVPTLADIEALLTIGSDVEYLVDSWSALYGAVGDSHALAPYRAVYDDPGDTLPSRIYFYDSNIPGDAIFMEIGEDTDGEVTFDYTNMDSGSGSYLYGTDEGAGWTMAHLTTDEITADVDFLFSLTGWLL